MSDTTNATPAQEPAHTGEFAQAQLSEQATPATPKAPRKPRAVKAAKAKKAPKAKGVAPAKKTDAERVADAVAKCAKKNPEAGIVLASGQRDPESQKISVLMAHRACGHQVRRFTSDVFQTKAVCASCETSAKEQQRDEKKAKPAKAKAS